MSLVLVSSSYIPESDEITILLTDINNDNSSNGGVVGYFWAKDNYTQSTVAGSNERVIFYIDSVMYANNDSDGDGNADNYWENIIYSTLAHEFQHMINFYQRVAKRGLATETWYNEMLSAAIEDIVLPN